ncbi:hypothetical protein [Rhizobium sp. 18055]|uniref:hypothetical protein n=1 Tax=Rhizobium sp. 18055 TaxID=2681403 RepID=UPI00135C938B|nr:hypothetical protein [Rhizobium sp. 18055]
MTLNANEFLDFGSSPVENVRSFIELVRHEIAGLIADEMWEDEIWPVGGSFQTKGHNRNNRQIVFYNSEAVITPQQVVTGTPLHRDFIDFAKAYVRYKHSTSPSTFETLHKRLSALQFIEAGFRALKFAPRIEDCSVAVLHEAVSLAAVGVGPGRHYQLSSAIQQVHDLCLRKGFYNGPFRWKHGLRKPEEQLEALGPEARARRGEKLPSMEALIGMGRIFANSVSFVDRLFSSISAICAAVPIRAHEVLQLRLDCIVEDEFKDEVSGEMRLGLGIRVWPGKGHPPQVKPIPTKAVTVVKEAVKRLTDMCAQARDLAAWYEKNPSTLWLPPDLQYARSSGWITLSDLRRLVNRSTLGALAYWVRSSGIEYRTDEKTPSYMKEVRVGSFAEHVLKNLPERFPDFNGRDDQLYSETLIIVFKNQLHSEKGTYPCVVDHVTVGQFEHWLSGHDTKPSVYKRWGIVEKDGSEIEITTHSFRHWLLTVAERNGLGELDMAFWSGHSVNQNKNYIHWTDHEVIAELRALDEGGGEGPMFEARRKQGVNDPVTPQEFYQAQIGSALATDFGYCAHDYSLLPCMLHGDCAGCSENVFKKGDSEHRAKTKKHLEIAERQLAAALKAMKNDVAGSDRWVTHHMGTITRLRAMIAIHDDLTIREGKPINLASRNGDSEIALAVRDRDALDGKTPVAPPAAELSDDEDRELLEIMRGLGED